MKGYLYVTNLISTFSSQEDDICVTPGKRMPVAEYLFTVVVIIKSPQSLHPLLENSGSMGVYARVRGLCGVRILECGVSFLVSISMACLHKPLCGVPIV